MKMKKVTTAIVISAFVIVLGGTAAFAAGYDRQETRGTAGNRQYSTDSACQGTGYHFTDADGDGICDYRDTAGSTGVDVYKRQVLLFFPHSAPQDAAVRHPQPKMPRRKHSMLQIMTLTCSSMKALHMSMH